jgi:hypothetical protein
MQIYHFEPEMINLLKRWLHTPRDDGKPRVLVFPNDGMSFDHLSVTDVLRLIDNIKMVYFFEEI